MGGMTEHTGALRIAVWQAASAPGDLDANLAKLDDAAGRAAAEGAGLLVTPEMYVTGYNLGPIITDLAAEQPLERVADIAARHGIAIVAGGPERLDEAHASNVSEEPAKGVANAAWFFDDRGDVLARHRKIHLFGDVDRALFDAGDAPITIVRYRGLTIAMLVCFDVEYPESVRAAARAGADLVAVPTALMAPFSFVNEHLIRVRAWENTVFVAYANQAGVEGEFDYVGQSVIASPWGEHLAQAGATSGELITALVDPAVIAEARVSNTYLADVRSELFQPDRQR